MNLIARAFVPLLLFSLCVGAACAPAGAAAVAKRYLCPPCASPCDTTVFTAPGTCPTCGMTLVDADSAKAAAERASPPVRVAILVFNGAEILDFSGPYEMFGAAGCDVYTVAATGEPVTTAMGLAVVPKYSFADAPRADVLVIPGGGVSAASRSDVTLEFIKATTARNRFTMSVCNGAFILASTGLLDGLTATTTNGNIPKLAQQFPKIKVVRDQRYVDNGHIITTAGLSAGMDGALHVIAKLFGTGFAQDIALGEEYDWKPTGGFARAALADNQIPQLHLDDVGVWKPVSTEGDRNHWHVVVSGHTNVPTFDLAAHVEQALEQNHWTRVSAAGTSATARTTTWRFTGNDGKPWRATLKIGHGTSGAGEYKAVMSVLRAG